MPDEICIRCGAKLSHDEIGLHKKLVNRGATTFMCKACLAREFRISIEQCDEIIEHYRQMGCLLFA